MNLNRICPECETEYLPHIRECADCGALLLLHEELAAGKKKKKGLSQLGLLTAVTVREGDLDWLTELSSVLLDASIPCAVTSEAGCNKTCCGSKGRLIVAVEDFERAQERIEEYFIEKHPEAMASAELINQGKCPACGSSVSERDFECPDCGLALIIVDEQGPE